jgi:hypothetical protein
MSEWSGPIQAAKSLLHAQSNSPISGTSVPRRPQVEVEIDYAMQSIEQLDQAIVILAKRLEPASVLDLFEKCETQTAPQPVRCTHAARIADFRERADSLTEAVNRLISNLEV